MQARNDQTLFDLALAAYGRAEAAVDVALALALPLAYEPQPGEDVRMPAQVQTAGDAYVVEAYERNGIEPATRAADIDAPTGQYPAYGGGEDDRKPTAATVAIALHRQTLVDVALAAYGRAEVAIEMAIALRMRLADTLAEGQVIELPMATGKTDGRIADEYATHGIAPATAADPQDEQDLDPQGISYWFVGAPTPIFTVGYDTAQ